MKSVARILYPILRWCPGALGLLLRQKIYPSFLAFCGKGVVFGRFVDLQNPSAIHIGDNAVISNRCRIVAGTDGEREYPVFIDEDVFIGIGTTVKVCKGSLRLKRGCNIGSACLLTAHGVTELGVCVLMAAFCTVGEGLSPGSFVVEGHIIIEEDVWLGARCAVQNTSYIGKGSIIGAHAKVVGEIPAFAIVTGDPALLKRYREK
ncbi:MAG TPA: hypothetical protein VJ969_03630 [Desulfopila sp.]|nr:hypothetical protein [Desulfopila sp.]